MTTFLEGEKENGNDNIESKETKRVKNLSTCCGKMKATLIYSGKAYNPFQSIGPLGRCFL